MLSEWVVCCVLRAYKCKLDVNQEIIDVNQEINIVAMGRIRHMHMVLESD